MRKDPGDLAQLHRLSMRLGGASDLRSLLEDVLEATIALQGGDCGHVQLYDEESDTLTIAAHRGVGAEHLENVRTATAGNASTRGRAMVSQERVIIEDVTTDRGHSPHRDLAAASGYRGVHCTPLLARGSSKPLGILSIFFRDPHRPTDNELLLTDLYARQAADMIDCRLADHRLREREEHFRLALEAGKMGIWEWDSVTHLIKGDESHQALFGMPPQDAGALPNELYWERMDPEESKVGTQRAVDALETGSDVQLELRVRPSQGVVRWIAVRGRPRYNGTASVIGISYDITERKKREETFRQSEGRLKSAVSLAKLGLYSWNPATDELSWDGTLKAMWGLPAEAPVDWKIWREGVHSHDLARVDEAIARAVDPEGDGVYDIEYRVIGRADREERWIATCGQVEFEKGRATSFLGVALDITDRKRTEERLEQLVETRTRQLEGASTSLAAEIEGRQQVSRRLEQLQMELFHASRLSVAGQMAATIAHELSQPLAAMVNSLGTIRRLLASQAPGAEISLRELTEDAGVQAERANQIIRRLRNFIRRGSPQRRPEPIKPLVEEAVAFAMTGPEGLGVSVSSYFDPLVAEVVVDRVQIQQVIANLVRNSLRAMKDSSRRELTVATQGLADMKLEIAITDSGEGVKEGFEQYLFEPFMTTRPDGMGLGLSICRLIVEAHGGDIRYRPGYEGGSTFSFTMPAAGQAAT